jgi:hypothetical protein
VSNADREFFKEMSGQISDPNIPTDKRLAAWAQVRKRLAGIVNRANKGAPAGGITPEQARAELARRRGQ